MNVTFRPLSTWPEGPLTLRGRRASFRAGWVDTMTILERELTHLGAERVVIEVAMTEADIRLDGWPRANATASHPGVVVSFASVRAIALALEALRKVDRFGVARRGEQYRGWKALPTPRDETLVDQGRVLIAQHGGPRAAQRATHPDAGGDADHFRAVQAAIEADQ